MKHSNILNNAILSVINPISGETQKLGTITDTVSISWKDMQIPPIDIKTSYEFTCYLDESYNQELERLYKQTEFWKYAVKLSKQLNDLIEEYHVPGTSRRERREINRTYCKLYNKFHKHCQFAQINYKFKRTR